MHNFFHLARLFWFYCIESFCFNLKKKFWWLSACTNFCGLIEKFGLNFNFLISKGILLNSQIEICWKFQAHDVEQNAFIPNIPSHDPDGAFLFSHVDIHDIQHLAVHSCSDRSRHRLFSVRLEEIGDCRCYRTLSLIFGQRRAFLQKNGVHDDVRD